MRIFQGRIWIYVQEKDIHEIREWYYVGPAQERKGITKERLRREFLELGL
jgi:hypothetical protein